MQMNRREALVACLEALPALGALAAPLEAQEVYKGKRLGIVEYSFGLRLAADRTTKKGAGLTDPLAFLEHCHKLGAGGVHLGMGVHGKSYTSAFRTKLDDLHMYFEGTIRLPRDRSDLERFEAELRTAREAGATVMRTVMLSGRRYESFDSADAFRKAGEKAYQSLGLAEPLVARHDLRLAVENHKDFRTFEQLDIIKRLGSRHVGICVDTGNNIALLEDPLHVVKALAPYAFAVHLKDMAVAEYDQGFLLAEVPLGDGFLDLKQMVDTLSRARPAIHFSLEMITRDPLKVPCLTPKYWATSEELPARYLAQMLALVRKHAAKKPLALVSGLSKEQQLAVEDSNVRNSLAYARQHLDL
jgi:sugar phosphate isomerase/epimerase